MDFIDQELLDYAQAHSVGESGLLQKIQRETQLEVLKPRMISGHLQGRFLAMISKLCQPKLVVEVGTYTGYSALCLAEGLAENGKLITMDINEELFARVRGYFDESGHGSKIDYRLGDAKHLIEELPTGVDLAFIDADKINYRTYFDLLFPKMNPGGLILLDNVLWSGKVLEKYRKKTDPDTEAILHLNRYLATLEGAEAVLLPLRDGITLVRKN